MRQFKTVVFIMNAIFLIKTASVVRPYHDLASKDQWCVLHLSENNCVDPRSSGTIILLSKRLMQASTLSQDPPVLMHYRNWNNGSQWNSQLVT